jgi:hypothetical protein
VSSAVEFLAYLALLFPYITYSNPQTDINTTNQ